MVPAVNLRARLSESSDLLHSSFASIVGSVLLVDLPWSIRDMTSSHPPTPHSSLRLTPSPQLQVLYLRRVNPNRVNLSTELLLGEDLSTTVGILVPAPPHAVSPSLR
jgi:hypothetical protein